MRRTGGGGRGGGGGSGAAAAGGAEWGVDGIGHASVDLSPLFYRNRQYGTTITGQLLDLIDKSTNKLISNL